MKLSIIAKLADFWVGFYLDRKHHRLYFLPLPCLGVCLDWSKPEVREPGRVTLRVGNEGGMLHWDEAGAWPPPPSRPRGDLVFDPSSEPSLSPQPGDMRQSSNGVVRHFDGEGWVTVERYRDENGRAGWRIAECEAAVPLHPSGSQAVSGDTCKHGRPLLDTCRDCPSGHQDPLPRP